MGAYFRRVPIYMGCFNTRVKLQEHAWLYNDSTDQLQGISLSRAKRQSEQVRAVSRLIVATHANVKQNVLCVIVKRVAQLRTLGGRYLDSLHVVRQ